MVNQAEELIPGDQLLCHSWTIYNEVLKPIDGIRRAWSSMLEDYPGEDKKYALAIYIVDIDPFSPYDTTADLTKNSPQILPAFIEYKILTEDDYTSIQGAIPAVQVLDGWWLDRDSSLNEMLSSNWFNINLLDEYKCGRSYYPDEPVAAPIWSLTPISEENYLNWSSAYARWTHTTTGTHPFDPWVFYTIFDSDGSWVEGMHGTYINEFGKFIECQGLPLQPSGCGCECGLVQAQNILHASIYNNNFWVDLGPKFEYIWQWTINRWLDGWQAMNTYIETTHRKDDLCPSLLVSSLSPYYRTLGSDVLALERERLLSTHLTNSQQWQEFLTEPSPQLTLFDT